MQRVDRQTGRRASGHADGGRHARLHGGDAATPRQLRLRQHRARKQAQRPFAEIVQILRDKADHRFTPPGQGPEAPLTDVIVHGLDITTPLGLSHPVPDEHLIVVLDCLAEPSPKARAASRQLDGVRLQADDLDWSHGDGPLVTGPARAILLALAGRDAGWDQLAGDVPHRSS